MKKLALAAALVGCGVIGMQSAVHAHGGQYRGPGDTVPPGAGGGRGGGGIGAPSGPGAPTTPGGAPTTPGAGSTPGGPGNTPGGTPGTTATAGASLTDWSFWWEFNKEPYLRLKAHLHAGGPATGDEGFFLGNGANRRGRDRLAPSERQIREEVVPVLLEALEGESNNDIVTGCLIALAKIGDPPSESGASLFEPILRSFLGDQNQEIAETAAVALGILASPRSVPLLGALVRDSSAGRAAVGSARVDERTRAFAAYGLGLIGARASAEEDRVSILGVLLETLEAQAPRSRDLPVACVIAIGLVPLETLEPGSARASRAAAPALLTSRRAQLDYLLAFLEDDTRDDLVRAHCPTALVRLLVGLPGALHAQQRERVASALLACLEPRSKEHDAVVQSAVLALGAMGTSDDANTLDRRIRKALVAAPRQLRDQQARFFALIALARLGGAMPLGNSPAGATDCEPARKEVARVLLSALADGQNTQQSWAALACGVFAHGLAQGGANSARIGSLQHAVRTALAGEKDPEVLGALSIAAGIMKDIEAKPALVRVLEKRREDATRGYAAIGLGLMNAGETIEVIQRVVESSRYRPELLKQAAVALGLLGDKQLVPNLVAMLKEARLMATQAALSSALGFIGDRHSIDPLTRMLADEELTPQARAFAAVALGIVGDKEPLPWNSKIGLDLNYRAKTTTLFDPAFGTGILDIL